MAKNAARVSVSGCLLALTETKTWCTVFGASVHRMRFCSEIGSKNKN